MSIITGNIMEKQSILKIKHVCFYIFGIVYEYHI